MRTHILLILISTLGLILALCGYGIGEKVLVLCGLVVSTMVHIIWGMWWDNMAAMK